MYTRGKKVKKDLMKATALYREAAYDAIPGAARAYGEAYLTGSDGVARDTNRALFWFRRALTGRDMHHTLTPAERDRARSIVTALERAGYAERREAPGGCEDDDKQYVTIVYDNGDRYNGEVVHGNIRQGWGAYVWASGGKRYEGEWKNGFRAGDGIYSSPQTGITYAGQSTDLFERVWGYTTSDSVTHYGTYQRSDEWNYCFSRLGMLIIRGGNEIAGCPGAVYYVGMFSNWKLRGRGRCYNKAGDLIYEGPFDEKPIETYPGVQVDTNIRFLRVPYADGVYVGETRHGKRSGFGVFHGQDGSVWIGTWESDARLRGARIDDRGRTKVEGYTKNN